MASKQEKIAAAIGVGTIGLGLGIGGYFAGRRGVTGAEVQAALTQTPIVGTPTPEWTPTYGIVVKTPTSESGKDCRVVHDYNLRPGDTEVATDSDGDSFIHVELYRYDGDPEREAVLDGGRHPIKKSVRGHVWEYDGCTVKEVKKQVDAHIDRRKAQGANNAGWAQPEIVDEVFEK